MDNETQDRITNAAVGKRLGMSYSGVSRIRAGERYPSLPNMRKIRDVSGWSIEAPHIGEGQDAADAEVLFSLLENEVIPLFYDRNESGVPQEKQKRPPGTVGDPQVGQVMRAPRAGRPAAHAPTARRCSCRGSHRAAHAFPGWRDAGGVTTACTSRSGSRSRATSRCR